MKKILMACIILAFAATGAFAETIYLKDGKIVRGKIAQENDAFIMVETGDDSNPYPGRYYSIGSGLCMTEDGESIITYYGNIFSASAARAIDMVPPKKYLGLPFQYAADSSAAAQMAAIPAASWYLNTIIDDTEVWIYDDLSFLFQKAMALPYFISGGSAYPGHGRFVFYDSTGTRLYIVMQADAASGLLNDFGVVTYE